MKKRVGILYVNVGGGHSSAAKALYKELKEEYSDSVEPILIDVGSHSNFLSRWLLHRGYLLLINFFLPLWWFFSWISHFRWVMAVWMIIFRNRKYVDNLLKEGNFDIIVSFYFFITPTVIALVKKVSPKTEIWTVVTDPFTVPPIWFFVKGAKYFVFSERAKKTALVQGIPEKNIFIVAPVINKKFFQARVWSKEAIRNELGFPLDKKIILVVAGGDGLYQGGKVVETLTNLPNDFCMVVVCGREKYFFDQATYLQKKYPNKILSVFGFVDNMEKLMATTDLIISKAGPATIFEALAVGRPLILTHYIWEQEKGNCDFVLQNGYGIYQSNLDLLPQTVLDYFENEYQKSLERIKDFSCNTGVIEIAQKILKTKNPE